MNTNPLPIKNNDNESEKNFSLLVAIEEVAEIESGQSVGYDTPNDGNDA